MAKKIIAVIITLALLAPGLFAAGAQTASNTPGAQATFDAALKKKIDVNRLNATKTAAYKKAMAAYKRGLAAEKKGNFRKAFYEYSSILKAKITYPQIYKRLAACYYAFANYEFAIKYYKKYLTYFPNDKSIIRYIPVLEAALKAKESRRLSKTVAGAEFKSPLSAILFSHIGLIPPAVLYQGYGSYYARNRNQNWFPVSSSMSILGEFCLAGGYALAVNSKGMEPMYNLLYNFGGYLLASAFVFDYATSPFIAVESTEEFLWFAKHNNMKIAEKKIEYKDPAFTALVSFVGGSVVPGAGHFFAGDTDTALKILIFTPILAGSTMITGAVLQGNDERNIQEIGKAVFWSGMGIYGICRLIDLYGSLTHTDKVNEEYYKQLVCPNSPFVLKKKLPEKEPWLAFLISLVPVPGLGNLYAENYWTAATLGGAGLAGAITYFAASDADTTGMIVKYSGLAVLALSKIYDIASAPGYTTIYNDVYTGRQEREKAAATGGKASIAPMIMQDGLGVNVAVAF